MNTYLLIYIIGLIISFVVFSIVSIIHVKQENSIFITNVYSVSLSKLILMAIFWPFAWLKAAIESIVNML